ncbi:hypothetical protein [Streptomyces sp. NBC_00989]|uniref:hypothetical protein n=1 Tax=Streptomyces sp. NBC_00989 TaxID=2903705 RepID=UPI00386FBE8C|nr:hypothetical protein OG714_07800 [Streptomyces sp. NBC_00989]
MNDLVLAVLKALHDIRGTDQAGATGRGKELEGFIAVDRPTERSWAGLAEFPQPLERGDGFRSGQAEASGRPVAINSSKVSGGCGASCVLWISATVSTLVGIPYRRPLTVNADSARAGKTL